MQQRQRESVKLTDDARGARPSNIPILNPQRGEETISSHNSHLLSYSDLDGTSHQCPLDIISRASQCGIAYDMILQSACHLFS